MVQTSAPFQFQKTIDKSSYAVTPLGLIDVPASKPLTFQGLALSGVLGQIGDIVSVWVDASQSYFPVKVTAIRTGEYEYWPSGAVGWRPLLLGKDATQMQIEAFAACTIGMKVSTALIESELKTLEPHASPFSNISRVAANLASVTLLAANSFRRGATFVNDGAANLYVLCQDANASTVNFTKKLSANETWQLPINYGGRITGIWDAALGAAQITEFV